MRYKSLLLILMVVLILAGCSNNTEGPKTKVSVSVATQAPKTAPAQNTVPLEPRYEATLAEGIDFSKPGFPTFIEGVRGISDQEDWGRWGEGKSTVFTFKEKLPERFKLTFDANALWPNQNTPITVKVGDEVRTFTISKPSQTCIIDFDSHLGAKTIEFIPPTPTSPKEIGAGSDTRVLGVGFIKMRIDQ